ncbi:hypothetical protein VTI28DRAFT_3417 [Corynascus sepedonium]
MLGLPETIFTQLAESADLVIYSGSRRSFWDLYYSLRDTNVSSIGTLLRMAASRRIPIHFLSSSGVLLLSDSTKPYTSQTTGTDSAACSVAQFQPPVDGSEGYVASKWASEVLLEKASRSLHIPVVIHRFTPRPASLLAEDGISVFALEDLVGPTAKLNAIPEQSTWSGRFDVVRSAALAESITDARSEEEKEPADARFVHHMGEAALIPTELFEFLEERLGEKVDSRLVCWSRQMEPSS